MIHEDAPHKIAEGCFIGVRLRYEPLNPSRVWIELIQPKRSPNPEAAALVFEKGRNLIVAKAAFILRVSPVMDESSPLRIESIEPAVRPNPQRAAAILMNRGDVIVDLSLAVSRVKAEVPKLAQHGVQLIQPSKSGADPQKTGLIFDHHHDGVVTKALGIARVVPVGP